MNNKLKRLLVGGLVGIIGLTSAVGTVGCGGIADNESTVEISYFQTGIGKEWVEAAIEKFEAKFPQYEVKIRPTVDENFLKNTIELGASDNSVDLYMNALTDTGFEEYLEPLDDILNYQHSGESKKIIDKIDKTPLDAVKSSDGHYYAVPFSGGVSSIAYNKAKLNGYELPNTTDELKNLVLDLKENDKTGKPFVSFENGGYWKEVYETWIAQYNGLDYYYNNWLQLKEEGKGFTTDGAKKLLVDENLETGRYDVLQLLELFLHPDNNERSSYSENFIIQQMQFFEGAGSMMANGSWLYKEMQEDYPAVNGEVAVSMMKVPVISGIIHRLPSIEDDIELSELIDAIDAAGTDRNAVVFSGADEEDIDAVYEARNIVTSVYDENTFLVPKYSNAKEATKEFLKFLYSDEMICQFMDVTHMNFAAMPSDTEYQFTNWNSWELEMKDLVAVSYKIPKFKKQNSILTQAKTFGDQSVVTAFASSSGRITADKMWENMQTYYTTRWSNILALAGY